MASMSDILTTAKNVVVAISGLGQTYGKVQGQQVVSGITADSVIFTGQGRVVSVSVIVAGSGDGTIYDASTTANSTAPLAVISSSATGVYPINIPVSEGIRVAPGTGMTVTVVYS